jgi:two-component system heavy metal sensor histidine kinase CusS
VALASPELQLALRQAREVESRRALAAGANIRLVAALLFLTLTAVMGLGFKQHQSALYVPKLLAYGVLAAVVWLLRRGAAAPLVGVVMAVADVAVVYLLQRQALSTSPFPAGSAGFTLGVMALLVTLSGSTLAARVVVVVTVAACGAEAMLMRQAGLGVGPVISAWVVLPLVATASLGTARRLRHVAVDLSRAEIERQGERRENEKLIALQRDKDSLIQLVVHDLRSPLTAMVGNIAYAHEVLKKKPVDASVQEMIEDALGAGDRLEKLISEMLDVARLEEGRLTLTPGATLPTDLFEAVRRHTTVAARNRSVSLDLSVSMPGTLFVDARLLTRVLENLVSNAIRYSPTGGTVLLEARTVGEQHLVAVHNNGASIDVALRATLFEKYRQGSDAASRNTGWGLGLYFCSVAVAAHGGQIAVEDMPGWNTSFVVRLPAVSPGQT